MKAVEYDRYGSATELALRDVPRPIPGPGELLVRVRAAALNPKDVIVRSGKFRLLSGRGFPKRVGFDWSGEIAELGAGVTGVTIGAAYYGMLDGYQGGACAEYVTVRPADCSPKPSRLDHALAATAPLAASTALQALRDVARLEPGMRVLVNGASGGVGVFAIQIARLLGATVTSTSGAANLELCRKLGAEMALDYRASDPLTGAERFDVVFDVFGNRTLRDARRVLTERGVFVKTVPKARDLFDVIRTRFSRSRAHLVVVRPRARDLELIARWLDEGKVIPVVDKVYPLDRIRDAETHVETKHTRGKVVVTID